MKGRCSRCGQERDLRPDLPVAVCYGCLPAYMRQEASRERARDMREHGRREAMADHPASGIERAPDLRAVGTPQGYAPPEPPTPVVQHRGQCGDPDCSDCENIRRAELFGVLGPVARRYGLTPKYVEPQEVQ